MASAHDTRLKRPVGEGDYIQGPPDAPVTFVEYGDYECPHCRQAHSIVIELQEMLGDQFRYVFRNFPNTAMHPNAQLAAEAAEAAAAQGKFWEMHDALFQMEGPLEKSKILQLASELDLDMELFRKALDEHSYAERVREDLLDGTKSGVNGTPTFFINGLRYDGPWDIESLREEIEKPLGVQIRDLFERFTRLQASGGILLVIATILALILANTPAAHDYFQLWETSLALTFGNLSLSKDLLHWINDGLMVIFFFVVGLEIKREILQGELATLKKAALPIFAAIGGILLPAGIYILFNAGTEAGSGWAIPVATDIAFTLGILVLLGRRVPLALKVFFTALAIADDLGAVLIIAIFYSAGINWFSLAVGAIIFLALMALNWLGVRRPLPYGILGVILWLAFLQSGVHPTIAGVLLAFTIPSRTLASKEAFLAQCISTLGGFEPAETDHDERTVSNRQQAAAHTLEAISERIQTPAQRLEHSITPWATYLVLPIFALANAGVTLEGNLLEALTQPLALGIVLGLVLGKPVGISLLTWLAVKTGIADMPSRVTWTQLLSTTFLAGIGFTMSLFITSSAFKTLDLISTAKISILVASLAAGFLGSVLLILSTSRRESTTERSASSDTKEDSQDG
jgi:NhaA family Na+:H+ antiporter